MVEAIRTRTCGFIQEHSEDEHVLPQPADPTLRLLRVFLSKRLVRIRRKAGQTASNGCPINVNEDVNGLDNWPSRWLFGVVESKLEAAVPKKPPPKAGSHTARIRGERSTGLGPAASPASPGHDDDDAFGTDFLTPDEMREWAQREMRDAAKALDLRARELFDLVSAYSAGKITAEKADELHSRYHHRWADALPTFLGDIGDPQRPDAQILADIDKNVGPFSTPRENYEGARAGRLGGHPSGGKLR